MQRRYDWFFDRISIFALPPLVLFWAGVMQRVGDYGLTDWRVYLIVCGAIMTAAIALFAARRTGRYYYIAATAFVLFFLTAYIPRFSATASRCGRRPRAERLAGHTGLLDESGRLDLSRIDERDTAQLKRYRELYASLDYLDDHDTLLLADRFGIARSRELLSRFHSDRIRDYIQWGYELDTAEAAALTSSYSNSNSVHRSASTATGTATPPVSFSYNNGSSRYTTSGDTLRLYLPDGRELFRRSFDELFTERCDQLLYWPDDEPLYTADNLFVLPHRFAAHLVQLGRGIAREAPLCRSERRQILYEIARIGNQTATPPCWVKSSSARPAVHAAFAFGAQHRRRAAEFSPTYRARAGLSGIENRLGDPDARPARGTRCGASGTRLVRHRGIAQRRQGRTAHARRRTGSAARVPLRTGDDPCVAHQMGLLHGRQQSVAESLPDDLTPASARLRTAARTLPHRPPRPLVPFPRTARPAHRRQRKNSSAVS